MATVPIFPDIVTRDAINFSEIYEFFVARTTDGESDRVQIPKGKRTAQMSITGDGLVSATGRLYGTNDADIDGILLYTFSLSGTDSDHSEAPNQGDDDIKEFPIHYYKVSDLTGTDAAVTATLAV